MSLLQQEETEVDDAALGEELTKGTSHVVIAAIIATVVVSLAIAAYVFLEQKPPIASGEIVAVWAHPQHTETSGLDASGAPMPKQEVDQVMVFTEVRLQNHTDHPLYLSNVLTNATLADGIHSSYAANTGDYQRIFVAYPTIPVPHNTPLSHARSWTTHSISVTSPAWSLRPRLRLLNSRRNGRALGRG